MIHQLQSDVNLDEQAELRRLEKRRATAHACRLPGTAAYVKCRFRCGSAAWGSDLDKRDKISILT